MREAGLGASRGIEERGRGTERIKGNGEKRKEFLGMIIFLYIIRALGGEREGLRIFFAHFLV